MTQLWANNAYSTLAAQCNAGATSLTLGSGEGARFPSPSGGDYFLATITQGSGTETSWEVVKVTARSTDTLTIVKGQEGTTDATWDSGSKIEIRWTRDSIPVKSFYGQFPGGFVSTTGAVRWYPPRAMTISKVSAWMSGTSSVDVVVNVKKNGTTAQSITITAGNVSATPVSASISLATTDYVTIDIGSGYGNDLVVQLDY